MISVAPIVASTPARQMPDSLRGVLEAEHLAPEAEVDAHISEHGPGERRGGGKNHRPAHHEDDGEKQGQQTGDADQNPLVEGEAGRLVLEGVRLPQIKLRQLRRAQLRDIGHGRSRIEGQAENISFRIILAFRRRALARSDGGDSRRTEIRPDEARTDKAEMRRHDQPRQLLLGIVGQREHDPRGLSPRLERADLDPPDDAVGTGRGRHLDAVALGAVTLDRPGEIDRVRIRRNPDRLHGAGGPAERRERGEQDQDADEAAPRAQGALHRPTRGTRSEMGPEAIVEDQFSQDWSTPAADARRFRPARTGRDRAKPR
jgi:hypothetical protein